jgi:prepilin-type N-terminal cleavage/methylation domain-containing protein
MHGPVSLVRVAGRARRGATLVETLVALAIVSLVAASAFEATAAQTRLTDHALRVAHAEWLARERLAMLRALSREELASLPADIASGRYPPPNDAFTWRVGVTPVSGELDLFEANVEITWANGSFALHTRLYVEWKAT